MKHDQKTINENLDALLSAIKRKYPLMLENEIPSLVSGWMNYWAERPEFSADEADSRVLDLESYYAQFCSIPANPAPYKYQPPDIQGMLEERNESYRARRIRNIKLGHRYADMDADEEALWRESEELRRQDKEESDRQYQIERLSKILPVPLNQQEKNALPPTSTQLFLLQIPDQIRSDFAQWCSRNNLVVTRKNWGLYVDAKKNESSDWIDPTQTSLAEEDDKGGAETSNDSVQEPSTHGFGGNIILDETDQNQASEVDEDANEPIARNFTDENGRTKRYSRIQTRPAQGKFRTEVLKNWHGACAITGQRLVVEACHLIAHADGGAASVENGIALAVDLHRLLDRGHLHFENGIVLMSDEARLEPRYQQLHGQELRTPIKKVLFV